MINFTEFLKDGVIAQQEYASKAGVPGPLDVLPGSAEKYKQMIEMLGHIVEETVETRMLIPRRPWKKTEEAFDRSKAGEKEFCREVTDILLFVRALMAYSGITPETFEFHFNEKMNYNLVREDHR